MTCKHAQQRNSGTHCIGGAMDGRNVSAGVCRACQSGRLNVPAANACPPHATFCPRFGLPTSEHACAVCTEERAQDPEFAQQMRTVGMLWGAMTCAHRQDTGATEEKKCCGGKTKAVPVATCSLTGERAACERCQRRSV